MYSDEIMGRSQKLGTASRSISSSMPTCDVAIKMQSFMDQARNDCSFILTIVVTTINYIVVVFNIKVNILR